MHRQLQGARCVSRYFLINPDYGVHNAYFKTSRGWSGPSDVIPEAPIGMVTLGILESLRRWITHKDHDGDDGDKEEGSCHDNSDYAYRPQAGGGRRGVAPFRDACLDGGGLGAHQLKKKNLGEVSRNGVVIGGSDWQLIAGGKAKLSCTSLPVNDIENYL